MNAASEHFEYKRRKTAIRKIMRNYAILNCDVDPEVVPTTTVHSDQAHALDRSLIIAAVVMMVALLGLSGGSVCDIDLYKLNVGYLKDHTLRNRINKAIQQREEEVRGTNDLMRLG